MSTPNSNFHHLNPLMWKLNSLFWPFTATQNKFRDTSHKRLPLNFRVGVAEAMLHHEWRSSPVLSAKFHELTQRGYTPSPAAQKQHNAEDKLSEIYEKIDFIS